MQTKRLALFLIGCIGARLLLVQLARMPLTRHYVGIFAFLLAIGFCAIYLTRSRPTGPEVFGEKIWWNDLRPVHGTLYAIAAWMILRGDLTLRSKAWMVLLLDVMIGLAAFVQHHF
jgi:hypothetical protein